MSDTSDDSGTYRPTSAAPGFRYEPNHSASQPLDLGASDDRFANLREGGLQSAEARRKAEDERIISVVNEAIRNNRIRLR